MNCKNCIYWDQRFKDVTKGVCDGMNSDLSNIDISCDDDQGLNCDIITKDIFFCANFKQRT